MTTEKILKELCAPPGVSGSEGEAADTFARLIAPYADSVEKDRVGNVLAYRRGGKKKLLLEAHSDEVGLIVTEVCGGFLKFLPVGGIDLKILPSSLVTVYGKEKLSGVIGLKPPHLQKEGEDKSLSVDKLAIDTGLSDASSLVSPGDIAVFDSPLLPLLNGRFSSRCMDDRACLCALIKAAEMIKSTDYDICFAATSGEEVGLRGAKCLARAFLPDIAISLDVTFGESHMSSEGSFPLGSPALCISPSLSRPLTNAIEKAAESINVPLSYEVCSGSTGTNAWAVAAGSPDAHTALLSVPLRYMHSVTEVLSLNDIENTARIIAEFTQGGEKYAF